jgi:hypothetical protein
VRGDSSGSQIRVTALFVGSSPYRCNSKGRYEKDLTSIIKFKSERTSTPVRQPDQPRTQGVPITINPGRRDTVATIPATPPAAESGFVGSRADGVYYRASCPAVQDIAPANRRLFRTAQEAVAAGYRRSRVPGC